MLAIGNLHRSALETERFFVRGVKSLTKKSWHSHIKIFTYLCEWMNKLLKLFGCTKLDDTDVDVDDTDNDVDYMDDEYTTTEVSITIPSDAIRSDTFYDRYNKGKDVVMYRNKDR